MSPHLLVTLICVVTVLVGDASAADACCFPNDQFTIIKSGVSASTRTGFWRLWGQTNIAETQDQAYDYTNNRFASFITRLILSPTYFEQHLHVIEVAGEDDVWIVDLDKQTCERGLKTDYPFHTERCLSDYLTYDGVYYLGDRALLVDGWYVLLPDPQNAVYSISVTQDCLPYSESYIGYTDAWKVSQNVASTFGYVNYTAGILDPGKYFTVPDYCQSQNEEETGIFSWW